MKQCRALESLCTLPSWFAKATLEDQQALVLNCVNVNGAAYEECAVRHACLIDHANKLENLFDKR
jgi:hypothetical protein